MRRGDRDWGRQARRDVSGQGGRGDSAGRRRRSEVDGAGTRNAVDLRPRRAEDEGERRGPMTEHGDRDEVIRRATLHQPTPTARTKVSGKRVPLIRGTNLQLLLQGAEGRSPLLGGRPGPWLHGLSAEGSLEESADLGGDDAEQWRMERGGHLELGSGAAVSEAEFLDRFVWREFALRQRSPGERMASHEEQVKNRPFRK